MNIDSPMNNNTSHLIISLPNGDELEHKQVPNSETLWNILLQFQTQKNRNLCKKYNKENRFELPQLIYNNYPFASTLKQLLSTTLFDIIKHKKSNTSTIQLRLVFIAQAFSINELNERISVVQKEIKRQEKQTDTMDIKNNESDSDNEIQKSGLDKNFAKDIDPVKAQSTEEIFRKMEMLLYKLCKVLTTKQTFDACMKFLKKIIKNVIIHPLNAPNSPNDDKIKDPMKYRKLNLSNDKLQNNLFKYEPALHLLHLIGFEKDDNNYLILSPSNENVVIFQALFTKLGNCQPPKAAIPIIDKQIKIYVLDDLRKFKIEEQRIIAQQNANKGAMGGSLSSQHRMALQKRYKQHHPDKLMGKEMREKKYGVQQKSYKFTIIRIEFPSKYVLEVKFHPMTAIYKLFEFVNTFLDGNILTLKYQLLLPPHTVIKNTMNDDNVTFKSMSGMIPACTIRFVLHPKGNKNVNYNGNYIKNELIQKYITKDITSLRSQTFTDQNEQDNNNDNTNSNQNTQTQAKNKKKTLSDFEAMKRRKRLEAKKRKLGM